MLLFEPRLLGCKTKQPLSFIVCGQFISRAGFIHHRRIFDENVLIMITEGTIYILILTAGSIPFPQGSISCCPQGRSISDSAALRAEYHISGHISARTAALRR